MNEPDINSDIGSIRRGTVHIALTILIMDLLSSRVTQIESWNIKYVLVSGVVLAITQPVASWLTGYYGAPEDAGDSTQPTHESGSRHLG